MEIIRGRDALTYNIDTLNAAVRGHQAIELDIGTGDGQFVRHRAQKHPERFVIGLDACRENLRTSSRRSPANSLFVIANAEAIPPELHGLASRITINFPWGSLLWGLLRADSHVAHGLVQAAGPGGELEIRLNASALAEQGWSLEAGAEQVQRVLTQCYFQMRTSGRLHKQDLLTYPSTWAKRLAFGRDPRAICLVGTRPEITVPF